MEKEQYRITQRLKEKKRYRAISKLAGINSRSMNDEINTAIDFYAENQHLVMAWLAEYVSNKLTKGGKK